MPWKYRINGVEKLTIEQHTNTLFYLTKNEIVGIKLETIRNTIKKYEDPDHYPSQQKPKQFSNKRFEEAVKRRNDPIHAETLKALGQKKLHKIYGLY
jgi:hypothetical protein